jgi:hypothetical protein
MPKGNHYWNFILLNVLFLGQMSLIYYWFMLANIKNNWNEYRCNPMFMPFADNIEQNFTYCIQNMQSNYMSYLLQPLNYITASLVDIGTDFNTDINSIRTVISSIRSFVTNIIQSIFGVFMNLIVEIQKMTISIKDLVGKIIGVVTVLLYVLSGSVQTMESLWAGPPGQMVKALGKMKIGKSGCFHPETKIKLKNSDKLVFIKDLKLGDVLKDGSIVEGIIKLSNRIKENFYELKGAGEDSSNICVTGNHFMKLHDGDIYVKVEEYAKMNGVYVNTEMYSDVLYNLIINTHKITLGNSIFWDWEDDDLYA